MGKKVLVVDDEDDLRQTVANILALHDYHVHSASNGREALTLLQNTDRLPDLILLDLMMPVMDGYEFRRRQLKHQELADIPVVVFTSAQGVDQDVLNPSALLEKPVEIERLLHCVDHST